MRRPLAITTLTLAAAFFLTVLGMRIPALDHNHGPKPRPRAVVEEIKSQVEDQAQQLQAQLDLHSSPVTGCIVIPAKAHPLLLLASCETAAPGIDPVPSRAPPSQLSTLS